MLGTDATTALDFEAARSYFPSDIRPGHRFVSCIGRVNGYRTIDLLRFNETADWGAYQEQVLEHRRHAGEPPRL